MLSLVAIAGLMYAIACHASVGKWTNGETMLVQIASMAAYVIARNL